MPSSKHIVVVKDLASWFPAAKMVTSTRADKVIPALSEIYETYGNPEVQISDNGQPFNSASMQEFARSRAMELRNTPPLHPSSNPVETFMRPLGKAMKIGHQNGVAENETFKRTLSNNRQTPRPANVIPPAAMLFRDGQRLDFPRRYVAEEEVKKARDDDRNRKAEHEKD